MQIEEKRVDGIAVFYATSTAKWREWLLKNHETQKSVWLLIFKKESGTPSVYYPEAVDEALCFGWIDSLPNKRDENSYYQYFSIRNPKSNWSGVNKEKVVRLEKEGKLMLKGLEMIALAKASGTWTALSKVEALILPDIMSDQFKANKTAYAYWEAFSKSTKRGILEWIYAAKKEETMLARIEKTISMAAENKKANFPGS
jgi:uncharacterized protein YdeI (YjbR/CyaY-like superfamily)